MTPRSVLEVSGAPDVAGPDRGPRAPVVDWALVERWTLTGAEAAGLPAEVGLGRGPRADAVAIGIAIPGYVVSTRLREVLEAAAPGALEFRACAVGGEPFWLMRVAAVLSALDPDAGDTVLWPEGNVREWNFPVWKRDVVSRATVFRVPQSHSKMWMTDVVAATYLRSGCTGLFLSGPEGEIQ